MLSNLIIATKSSDNLELSWLVDGTNHLIITPIKGNTEFKKALEKNGILFKSNLTDKKIFTNSRWHKYKISKNEYVYVYILNYEDSLKINNFIINPKKSPYSPVVARVESSDWWKKNKLTNTSSSSPSWWSKNWPKVITASAVVFIAGLLTYYVNKKQRKSKELEQKYV